MNAFASILLPFLGAMVGIMIGILIKPYLKKWFLLILPFSGAFLLGIIFFELMPTVFRMQNFHAGIWIAVGLLVQIFLEYASQGAEHGHVHRPTKKKHFPLVLWLSLCLHAFIEGLPLSTNESLTIGIFVHKIPIAAILVFLIYESNARMLFKILSLFLFSLMTPLGSFALTYISPSETWNHIILSIVIGALLHIATTILFESNQNHAFNIKKILIVVSALFLSFFLA